MPRMTDVFVMGSINQDFVLKVERRPKPGETVTDAVLSTHNGGKGANQAAAAALLGASVAFLGRVGDDGFGGALVEALREKGVDTALIEEARGASTGTAFITVTEDGENAITVAPGANRRLTPEDVDAARGAIGGAAVLVAQMEVPRETIARAVEVAGEVGTRVILNLAPPFEVPRSVLEGLSVLVVNEHEAAFLLGERVEGVEGALAAAPGLVSLGPASVVVTVGADGAVFAEGGDAGHVPAPEAEVVDTTGAGDAFVGALAHKLARGGSLQEAAAYAVRAGAAAVTREGAQGALPTPDVLEAM
ncbi:MAG: Ribokinase [uncultured Rubrobacteraceae bacterium]|uniref:Ribokinase n=1 Tax=uncultured Rubrobacteraceae bacterium TaxID=349277 RepID=A0A6J4QHZ1_9ACTN|nr:MAG: Ribokinase [uncultured Rubrobacteraceae bacterium]